VNVAAQSLLLSSRQSNLEPGPFDPIMFGEKV